MTRSVYTPQLDARWSSARGGFDPRFKHVSNRWIAVPILIVGIIWASCKVVTDAVFGRFE